MGRGVLRIYLGAAPGVGKTYAMLGEAHRRKSRGTDVVVGLVETHGRAATRAMIGDLPVVDRRRVEYRGAVFEELDVDAILERRPQVVCVDELAHTNVPGTRHEKRWQDVQDLLDAGITVLSTVNVQHLDSLNDVVEKITGIRQQETVPDAVVRAADQVELVDVTPEALRRRMAHGNVYPAERIDAALGNYFRLGNLTALRELALLWLADKVDEALQQYRRDHEISATWETRERVVVALTGGPEGETLIRRAARVAARAGGELLGVHVSRADGLAGGSPAELVEQRRLLESLGGTYHELVGENVPETIVAFAHERNATQLVVGASRRSALQAFLTGPGIGSTVVRLSGDMDVHMVPHDEVGRGRRFPGLGTGIGPRRRLGAALLTAGGLPLITVLLASVRDSLNLASDALLLLVATVALAATGGLAVGLLAVAISVALLDWFLVPPTHSLRVVSLSDVVALLSFALVGSVVSLAVERAARRAEQADRAAAELRTLATLAGDLLRRADAVEALLQRLQQSLALDSVTLLERDAATDEHWRAVATVGAGGCAGPAEADATASAGDTVMLAVRGRVRLEDRRLLDVFATHATLALEQARMAATAEAAKPLAAADRLRTALLAAVSHDLRTPLAAATAAVDGLASRDVAWTGEQRDELVLTAQESLLRLGRLVDNLLDMSRLQAGALSVRTEPTRLDEVLPLVLDALGPAAARVAVSVPPALPEVVADPALLERVVANVVQNALRFSPPGRPPTVAGSAHGDVVELRVVDHGPGVPHTDWDRIFTPFQRLGDTDNTTGVGLGLALARGLTEAMRGELVPEETPGGGLTMVVRLPAARPPEPIVDVAALARA